MCGIFGIQFFNSSIPVDLDMVRAATDTMIHRGPDDSGYFAERNIGMGHRRLSIIDLVSGHQPMFNQGRTITLVYNGEIYNYKEIKKELVARGHKFRTECDTEVIIHGYEEWGFNCIDRFNGMFAFILRDEEKQRLLIVRDRLGIKPLYYYLDEEVFIAASEIKAILKTGIVNAGLNENVLDAYFTVGYVPGEQTMFSGINKLLPGHYMVIDRQGCSHHEYWDFSAIPEQHLGMADAVEKLDAILHDCVQKRLLSDVPVGAFLSGGLDSSAVVGLMSESVSEPVNTFTVAYHQGFSEKEYADIVAKQFSTNHNVFYLESDDFFQSLKTLVTFAEEPIVEPAAIALYHISKLARETAIVLLSGEGSDEIFAGYYLYHFMEKIEKVRKFLPETALSAIPAFGSLTSKFKYKKYLDWFSMPLYQRYQGTSSYLTSSQKKSLYHPNFAGLNSTYLADQFAGHFQRVQGKDYLSQMLYVDTKTWLVDDLLVKADKMTMAASVELRVPFLDHRLVEFAASLPSILKNSNGEGKHILKKCMGKYLPKEIIYREKKGFPVPTQTWLQGDTLNVAREKIASLSSCQWFDSTTLESVLKRQNDGVEDHSKLIMSLLVIAEWREQYL